MGTMLSKRRKELKEYLRQRALKRLGGAITLLYAEGAKDVYVFGTVLKPQEFNEHSDVDIAARGVPENKKGYIIRKLEEIFAEIPFDVVFVDESLRPEIREKIQKEGIRWRH
jgi:predicted nucleotidyltransferase